MAADKVRKAKPGEMCPCGKPARVVVSRQLGDVPTCMSAEEIAGIPKHVGILPSSGQSGAR